MGIEEFFMSENSVFYPKDQYQRASLETIGCEEICPYSSPLPPFVLAEMTREQAKQSVEKGSGRYCYTTCEIKNCPFDLEHNSI